MDSASLLTLQNAQSQASAGTQASTLKALENSKNAKAGSDFEAMVLSNLLSPMFEGLSTDGPFGGGQGEEAMRSFYIDAMAKNFTQHGGIGISAMLQKQLLQLQEGGA